MTLLSFSVISVFSAPRKHLLCHEMSSSSVVFRAIISLTNGYGMMALSRDVGPLPSIQSAIQLTIILRRVILWE